MEIFQSVIICNCPETAEEQVMRSHQQLSFFNSHYWWNSSKFSPRIIYKC